VTLEKLTLYSKQKLNMSINIDDNELVVMEEKYTFCPSLPVPNVQEMVKINPLQVPKRYVRNQEEMEKENYMPQLSSEIPVIDLILLSNGNLEELQKLDLACKEWGFFQVILQLYIYNCELQRNM
jgi:hypothetical protein